MKFTKSVRELAADINAAPDNDNYDSNDEVSEKCLCVRLSLKPPEFSPREGEGATERRDDADEGEGTTDGQEDVAFPLATSGRRLG